MTTTYDYTDEEIANPSGRNSQSARAKFFQRSLYKEVIYPEDIAKPLDSWYDKNLYGRINQDQTSIIPRQSNRIYINILSIFMKIITDHLNIRGIHLSQL